MSNEHKKGLLVVLASPSGGGKTSIYRELLARNPSYKYSVSATTRPPRQGEQNGVDYFFYDDNKFVEMIANGEFIEWAWVHGYRYGTLKRTLQEALSSASVMLFDLDVQGAKSIKQRFPDDTVTIFILPPSRAELERRLRVRGTDSDEIIKLRLKNADEEVARIGEFDYILVNDILESCVQKIECIITAELCKTHRFLPIEW